MYITWIASKGAQRHTDWNIAEFIDFVPKIKFIFRNSVRNMRQWGGFYIQENSAGLVELDYFWENLGSCPCSLSKDIAWKSELQNREIWSKLYDLVKIVKTVSKNGRIRWVNITLWMVCFWALSRAHCLMLTSFKIQFGKPNPRQMMTQVDKGHHFKCWPWRPWITLMN